MARCIGALRSTYVPRATMVALLIALGSVGAVHAGPLAPSKPSALVTIRGSGRTCGTSPWRALDQQVNPDGTLSSFTIPPKMVWS